jgi:hypothetical protein
MGTLKYGTPMFEWCRHLFADAVYMDTPIGRYNIHTKDWIDKKIYQSFSGGSFLGEAKTLEDAKKLVYEDISEKTKELNAFVSTIIQ